MSTEEKPPEQRKGGRPRYQPADADRRMVETMASFRIPHDDIAKALSRPCDAKTLRLHFREELDRAEPQYKAGVARAVNLHLFGRRAEYDEQGRLVREEIKPHVGMAMFQARVVLGQKEVVRVEHILTPEALKVLDDDELSTFTRIFEKILAAQSGDFAGGSTAASAGTTGRPN